jgi:cell division protein FtsX
MTIALLCYFGMALMCFYGWYRVIVPNSKRNLYWYEYLMAVICSLLWPIIAIIVFIGMMYGLLTSRL